ncbi:MULTISPECIES: urea ABC transporter permease subunit UrtB [unclassified Aureimonas]|uniref:urea ABC transporter permease subunit UrtB n=1 Tax=unclassified Aureimonas TaxID=2615206 RepID=UPI0006FC31B9|nr:MULTISPECIES: urea ABC transporter permease subunit UrtB [unclassified Aureimonas]KQT69977.1 urea ABC transporter permease [Aureimonas sp. Leaf427]KQT75867.1 urea ABC transporter permease [Aureimonas sp. Leaf460]
MTLTVKRLLLLLALVLLSLPGRPAAAQESGAAAIIAEFAGKRSFSETEATVKKLAATGDLQVANALNALAAGELYYRKADNSVVIARGGDPLSIFDALTGEPAGTAPKGDLEKVKVKNSTRNVVADAMGSLTLRSPDEGVRRSAALNLFTSASAEQVGILDAALAEETVPDIKAKLAEARAAAVLKSDLSTEEKLAAIETVSARGDRQALAVLSGIRAGGDATLTATATRAAEAIEGRIAAWSQAQNIWYGISLGSVLLLAAIGLAITFGVMGVINMAHGEMIMLGAYTTFVVQEAIRSHAPFLFDYSLAIALPLAFLVAGSVGLLMERCLIRFLYGRPLETLLATYGVSLILQQAVRLYFGATNQEVGNPSWMSGSFQVGLMAVTWNRMWIILFALAVFAALLFALNRTSAGLKMRAVTQNRKMASAMGIRTPFVDAMTFALGSGIAGIAGVALSQIDNVSPDLGQGYIIDSFMVVVFGGVGNLWGTLVGAMSLGILNKFLEPYAGAVVGKIVVLVLIILFIQKRPRGLFAQKGRFVDA